MFRKKCHKCGRKISKDFDFCPYCGYNFRGEQEERDFGFLGKNDFIQDFNVRMPFGFNKLFSSLVKQLDNQFHDLDKELGKPIGEKPKKVISKGFSINISTGTGKKPEIKIRGFGPGFENLRLQEKTKPEGIKRIKQPEISEYKARKLAKLPKEEAETIVRRLSNRIIYEIKLPGVKKIEDVIINQLENSIEIKAFSKDKAYFKLLPINLPILDFKLDKETLILELKAKD